MLALPFIHAYNPDDDAALLIMQCGEVEPQPMRGAALKGEEELGGLA
jgi:hypothetical protein